MASSADMPLTFSRARTRSWLSFSSSSRLLSSSRSCFRAASVALLEHVRALVQLLVARVQPAFHVGELRRVARGRHPRPRGRGGSSLPWPRGSGPSAGPGRRLTMRAAFSLAALIDWADDMPRARNHTAIPTTRPRRSPRRGTASLDLSAPPIRRAGRCWRRRRSVRATLYREVGPDRCRRRSSIAPRAGGGPPGRRSTRVATFVRSCSTEGRNRGRVERPVVADPRGRGASGPFRDRWCRGSSRRHAGAGSGTGPAQEHDHGV